MYLPRRPGGFFKSGFSLFGRVHVQVFIKWAEFREADLFAVKIFCSPNSVPDSVSDSESHDIKILT